MPELDDAVLFGEDADSEELADGVELDASDDEEGDKPDLEGQFEKPPVEAKPEAGRNSKTVTLTSKEVKAKDDRIRELEAETNYWKGVTEGSKSNKREEEPVRNTAKAAAKPDDGDDTEEFLKDVNARGMKAIRERGLVSRDEIEALIEERAGQIARGEVGKATQALHSDAQLIRNYPDLGKADSDFSKRVAVEVREMVKMDENMAKSNATIAAAAKIVEAQMKYEKKRGEDIQMERRKTKQGLNGSGGDEASSHVSPMLSGMLKSFGVTPRGFNEESRKIQRQTR